jgi:hypothetical protein
LLCLINDRLSIQDVGLLIAAGVGINKWLACLSPDNVSSEKMMDKKKEV